MSDGGDEAGTRMSDSESSYDEIWDIMWENGNSDDEAWTKLWDNGSPGDETLAKKPKLANDLNEVTIDEHLEATEEAGLKELILDSCGNFLRDCKELPDQLYDSLIEGLTTLVYLLYDKEDLYRMGSSRMVIDQQNKFWEELAPTGEKYYRCEENMKSIIDDDILKAIRKVKLCPRLTVDQYTILLTEMFMDRDMKCQEFLVAKAVEIIDVDTLYSLDAHTLCFIIEWLDTERSPHEEFDSLLKRHLFNIILWRKMMVKDNVESVLIPYSLLLLREDMLPISENFNHFCEVAELRRRRDSFYQQGSFLVGLS